MTPNRRDVLEFVGATATLATVGTAGCVTVDAREELEDDLPGYGGWLTLDDGGLEFVYVDWASIGEAVQEELEVGPGEADVPDEFEADPMIAPVSEGLIRAFFSVGLDLAQFRLGRLLDDDAFESTVEELLLANQALVVTGNVVPEEIDEQLTADPEAEFIRQMEETAEIGDYDVYTPVEDDVDVTIAVGSDALVVVDGEDVEPGEDPSTILETIIGASEGDVDRATDESEAFEWLVGTAGYGDVVVGQYGGPFDAEELAHSAFEGLEDAEGMVTSLAVEDDETSTGIFAAIIDEPDEDALEEFLGVSADESSIDVDEDRVTATATWREVE